MKAVKKVTTKKFKPAYIVNIASCDNVNDTKYAFIKARATNGLPITKEEFEFVEDACFRDAAEEMYTVIKDIAYIAGNIYDCACKKQPWYKKLWNKLCRK